MHAILSRAGSRYLQNSKSRWAKISSLVLLSIAASFSNLNAQNTDLTFEQISIEQGLSQSIVECIVQDSRGFMWFGTEDGLNKYDGYRFTVLKHDPDDPNSLSYNQVLSIFEGRSGMLWIGTFHGGLNRYDLATKQFTHYKRDPDDPNSLSHNIVRSVYEDHLGVLWVGTDGGLNRYNRETEDFTRFLNDPDDPNSLSHNFVSTIYEDRSGALWIGTDGGGLNRYDRENGRFIRYRADPNEPGSLSHNSIRAIFEDQSGALWIGTVGGGLNKLDRERKAFVHYLNDPSDTSSLSHNEVYSIYEDRSGILWVGTNGGGLNRFDRDAGKFARYLNDPNDPNSLSYNEIYSIFEDRSGVIWLGTYGGGVNKFDRKKKKFVHYAHDPNDPNSLNHDIVWSIYEDEEGIIWIGTHGGGLNRFNRENNQFTHYRNNPDDPNSISNDIVRLVYEDRSGVLWIGTHGGGINKFDRETERFTSYRYNPDDLTSLSHDEIRSIYEDRSGVLWIGTNGGGLNEFDRQTEKFTRYQANQSDPNSLSNDFVRVIYEDEKRALWIGTQGGGLNRFDRKTGEFTHYKADPDNPNTLSSDFIFSIHEDKSGIFWIGTWGGGLNRFDREKGIFSHYTTEDGLANNSIYGALEDEQGNLWMSTNNGLSRFDPRTETFKNYDVEDGLQSNEFNGGSFFKSRSGEMFFGGINGFNSFYPMEIEDNPYIPPVMITSFMKLNREVELDKPISEIKELTLSHKDFVFSFEFAALDYTAPRKNLYAYKLEGLHEDWIYTDSERRSATFTTLAPGKYVFRVKGSNNDGIWNEEGSSIKIVITPPFWKTWWFRILVALAILILGFVWYEIRLRNIRMKIELQAAHDAQMSIMPQADPEIEGFDVSGVCIPANEVGGDFYDYFWQDQEKTKLGIAVGDVSGKAMKAAMIAVMSSGMISSRADETSSPRDVLTLLNRPMYTKTDEAMYTALCLASINIPAREFTYTVAGISEPLLKSGDSIEHLGGAGPGFPLGAFSDSMYNEGKVQLKAGDVLVMFTDGIIEAQNSSREFYESNRLMNLLRTMPTSALSAREIKDEIIKDVKKFAGNVVQYDDMTVVVVKST